MASVISIGYFNLKPGIDFSGGIAWEIKFSEKPAAKGELLDFFNNTLQITDAAIIPQEGNNNFLIRFKTISETEHQQYLKKIEEKFGALEELQFQNIGPSVGEELRKKSLWAFGLVLLAISLYVAFAFRKVSRPVSSWKYGIITLVTLFHDALIPAGMFAMLGKLLNAEVDTNFVVAILVVMGFSVHDTIVVFDRIRENLRNQKDGQSSFENLVNQSVNETMSRSINTSLTLALTLIALYIWGPDTLKLFNLVILVGTVVGTYSSIFVASPLLTLWQKSKKL
mgnify:CR=1 FL=1